MFENIRRYFTNFLNKLSKEQKIELKNIKIINEEILNQLIIDNVITKQESKYLKNEIDDESEFTQEQINELFDIQNTLFNANIVNTAELISEKVSLSEQDFLKL
jgi:signal recognition particle GTPase